MTIRERVRVIAADMLSGKPTPQALSEFEVSLAGLLSHVNDEVCEAEIEFRVAVLEADAKTAAGKTQIAEAGPTFRRLMEAQTLQKSCSQMLTTCRSAIRLKTEEMRRGL
jgi:hypothetical protein